MPSPMVLAEVFQIDPRQVPKLHGYEVDVSAEPANTVGGRLCYRLSKVLGGHWVWTTGRAVTDAPKDLAEIEKVVNGLWEQQPQDFRYLRGVRPDFGWDPTPQAVADFFARGLLGDLHDRLRAALTGARRDLGAATVVRDYDVRGWVVQGHPSLSISVESHLLSKQDLMQYAQTLGRREDLLGLWVMDKASRSLKGEIVRIVGSAAGERSRLLRLAQREEMRNLIRKAPDDTPVVAVAAHRDEYDYVANALDIVLRIQDCNRFHIDPKSALSFFRIAPHDRLRLVQELAAVIRKAGLIADPFSSEGSPSLFLDARAVGFEPRLRFGREWVEQCDESGAWRQMQRHGLFRVASRFATGSPLRIGILNALEATPLDPFLERLEDALESVGIRCEFLGEYRLGGTTRAEIEGAIDSITESNPDIILAFLPDSRQEEDDWGGYHDLKSLAVGRGIPSQVVERSTLEKAHYAMGNISLGILGKTGNIPFVLADPLPYADLVVGIDIARERKRRLPGSLSATAIARIYFSDGQFLRYVIHDAPLEGETVPDNVLQRLFPISEFRGKRVVIHRDGYFRGQEREALRDWGSRAGATFHLVEVIKSGTPRLYGLAKTGTVQQPPKGSALKLNDTEAFLVSSLPPFADATPQPLHIRTDGSFPVERAIHSVLSLTILHYGSTRAPRLPVTIHYSDRIAYLALRGIKPRELEGSVPFWL